MAIAGFTVAVKVVLFFVAVIGGAASAYAIAMHINPDFDKKLWK